MIKNYTAAMMQSSYLEDLNMLLNRNHIIPLSVIFGEDSESAKKIKECILEAKTQVEIAKRVIEDELRIYYNSPIKKD